MDASSSSSSCRAEIVALAFLIELKFLKGRDRLQGYDITPLIEF